MSMDPSSFSIGVHKQSAPTPPPAVESSVDEVGILTATVDFGGTKYTVTIKMLSGEKKIEKDSDLNNTILKIIKEIKLEQYKLLSGTTTQINLDDQEKTQVKLKEREFTPLSKVSDPLKTTIKNITEVFRKHFSQYNAVIQKQQPVNQTELKSYTDKFKKHFKKLDKFDKDCKANKFKYSKMIRKCMDELDWLKKYYKKNGDVKNKKILLTLASSRKRLNEIAGNMIDVYTQGKQGKDVHLMGDKTELKKIAQNIQVDPEVKKGLEILDEKGFSTVPIKGDGHCQFRSIAAALLYNLKNGKPLDKKVKKDEFQKEADVTQIFNDVIE